MTFVKAGSYALNLALVTHLEATPSGDLHIHLAGGGPGLSIPPVEAIRFCTDLGIPYERYFGGLLAAAERAVFGPEAATISVTPLN